jgi:tRNA-dihydrouridine synthase B
MTKSLYQILPLLRPALGRSPGTPGGTEWWPSTNGNPPVFILAPLAGVSDHPFRRICQEWGADLTYVEMLSATALLYQNKKTLDMAVRHQSEPILGVQVTGKDAEEVARAVEVLNRGPYDTIDLNMGCPVNKVVGAGCGSALLKDPELMARMIRLARTSTDKPLSVKIRLGWDRSHTGTQKDPPLMELLDAVEKGGAAWVTIHGRYRSDDYGVPVDLDALNAAKTRLQIPVIGNGNLFGSHDVWTMAQSTQVDGFMVSRGALGHPWIFQELKTNLKLRAPSALTIDDWESTVLRHLSYQRQAYGDSNQSAVVMRKHLLWYTAGWPGARRVREVLAKVVSLDEAQSLIECLARELRSEGHMHRPLTQVFDCQDTQRKFSSLTRNYAEENAAFQTQMSSPKGSSTPDGQGAWDPKWEMDRQLDRGVGAFDAEMAP